MPLMVRAYN